MNVSLLLGALSLVSAFACGSIFYCEWRKRVTDQRRRMSMLNHSALVGNRRGIHLEVKGIPRELIKGASQIKIPPLQKKGFLSVLFSRAGLSYGPLCQKAGLWQFISRQQYAYARLRYSAMGAASGLILGSLFSFELAAALFLIGLCLGWSSMPFAFKQEILARNSGIEKHLSEMIEVVALALRSGMTFDRAVEMYHTHFETTLSHATALAQQRWVTGLATREDALRDLSASYDSALFERVIGNIVRSLRFGAKLADSLEASAAESRSVHKSQVEERVAKAPVKMLIPTGTLILPAMLLLVLGPVLLDLMQGF